MIITLDENNEIILTEQAMMIEKFRKLYERTAPDMVPSVFGVIYFMYSFDSKFRRLIDDKKERYKAVKNFIYKGNDIKIDRYFREASELFEEIYSESSMDAYFVLLENLNKLKEYARAMVLRYPPEILGDKEAMQEYNVVDYKEFSSINEQIPKTEQLLKDFELRLKDEILANISVYGGGDVGFYEN